jgi:hypothetical protein
MNKSEIYDKRPTLGTPGESWDMFIVRKLRERREEEENNKGYANMSHVDVTIYYESNDKKKIFNVDRAEVDKLIEFHSKPINGKVIEVCIEEAIPREMDLDGYFALVDSDKA